MTTRPVRMLVAIANHGERNREHVRRVIQAYRSMPFAVDIVVLSDTAKDYGEGVRVQVGLPTSDPWSLPFGHKALFAQCADRYDLFVYSEDDVLIRTPNVLAFMQAAEVLPGPLVPGFVRYELYPDGSRSYPDIHGPFHWIADSVQRTGKYVHARLSNDHSACYMLTRAQLQHAIASGGFLVGPHSGRYDLLCSAGTDPYTQCGLTRVVCLSHLEGFEVHHLSNAYVRGAGLVDNDGAVVDQHGHALLLRALLDVLEERRPREALFQTRKSLPTAAWDKSYHEACRPELIELLPAHAREVLSVGCGSGATEARLVERGVRVTAIPLDSVIAAVAAAHGIEMLEPDFGRALACLAGRRFDAVLLSEVLQHLREPVDTLRRLKPLLREGGVMAGSVPNLGPARRWIGQRLGRGHRRFVLASDARRTGLNRTDAATARRWLAESGFSRVDMRYQGWPALRAPLHRLSPLLPAGLLASEILFRAA